MVDSRRLRGRGGHADGPKIRTLLAPRQGAGGLMLLLVFDDRHPRPSKRRRTSAGVRHFIR